VRLLAHSKKNTEELLEELLSEEACLKIQRVIGRFLFNEGYGGDFIVAAEDLAQKAVLAALKGLPNFKQESSISTWLHRIAINQAKSFMKSGGSKVYYPARTHGVDGQQNDDDPEDVGSAVEDILEQRRVIGILRRKFGHDPERYLPLVLYAHFSLKYEEIAALTSRTPKAVKAAICQARKEIRALVEGHES